MTSVFVSLVDQLAKRHGGVQRHNAGLDADEQAARLFLTSCDLVAAFRHADICTHLEDMMLRQWPQLLPTEPVTRTTTTTTAAAVALPTASVPTLIAASGALVGFLWTRTDGEEVGSPSREWVCAMHDKWESAVLQVLGAYPPFSAEACTAACYAVGQLSLLPGGCCSRVLAASCAALQAGSEDGLTAVLATELLGQCTSLMVLCKPFELRGALLVDPAAAAEGDKKKKKSAAGSAQPGKRARPATQRPSAPEGKEVTAGGQAAEKVDASASTELTLTAATAESCTALPSCYPFPTKERVAELRAELIECCLAALGAPVPSSSVTVATTVVTNQSRTVPTALVCQRVLIPLLLLDGSAGLERYEALIHNLLHTLATRADASADRASRHDAVRSDGGAALRSDNCDDVVLLIAALFDFLFRQPSCDPATDFRFSPFLWDVLSGALHHSLTATAMDAGHRANMQLRVEYLLKRIVYLTKGQGSGSGLTAAVVDFHPLFRWCRGGGEGGDCASATSWDNFFLVLESLNEYGWHIIEPVMARLDTLIADLNTHLEACHSTASAAPAETTRGALHTQWIEMLLLKLILHPNVGVRKVGLRRVWGLPLRVVQSLSPSFLFQYTFQSASDPRLCTDLDRVPITASFLDTKAFEGTEVKAVPDVEPLAQEVEQFYSAVFLSRWQDCASVARDVAAATTTTTSATKGGGNVGGAGESAETCLVSTRGRIDALQRLLDTSLSKPPRFTVCVLARTLLAIGQVLFDHKVNTEAIILNEGVLRRLHRFMRDSVQENIPFWLDVRVTTVLFAALTTFAAATPAPQRCRQHPSFWRLYCMCGPLGESGGHSITGMDACGQYGLVGASVDERFLQQWLVELSGSVAAQQGGRADTASGKPFSLVSELLDVEGIAGRVGRLLAPSATATSSSVNVVEMKETFFLLGTLNRTGAACDAALVRATGHLVASAVASLQARSYCSLSQLLSSAACLVEYHHTVGSEVCARVWPLRTTLQAMSTALHTHAMGCLSAALHAVVEGSAAGRASVTHASAASEEDVWPLMSITHFDIVAAAVAAVNTTACYCAGGSDGDTDAHSAAADVLGTARTVEQLVSFISEATAAHQRIAAANKRHSEAAEDAEAGAAALLVVLRNAYRLLQSVLCGLLNVKSELVECEGGQPSSLPTHREPIEPTAVSRCPPALRLLPSQAVLSYVRQLIALPSCRVPTVPVPSALSDMPWSTLLGHHGRYRSNILYVLLLCLRPAAHAAGSGGGIPHDTLSPGDYRDVVALVQDFALGQLEECWTMNLASVYDLLVWVASSELSDVVDYVAIARGMFDHMKEVGARQHTRLAALAFSVLPFVMPHHPDYVRELLLRVLAGEGKEAQTADRDVYFAAMTASLQVLRNPVDHWPVLRPVLLYAALLFNTNRDEEENESTVAVTEPLLWSWPAALRLYYPPTTRMSAVGRAMAVATLLWCCQADVAGRAVPLTMELLQMNVCHPVVTHEPCMPNSRTHRTRIRLWQLLCALLPSLAQTAQPVPLRQVEEVFRLLIFHCVTVNNMGSVRRLMELYAIRLVEQHPGLYTVISEALGNYSLRPQVCGTYILIACHALLRQEEKGAAAEADAVAHATFDSLFPRILQQSTSNQHLLRIISHIGLVNICQRRIAHGRPLSLAVQAIYDYVLHAPEHIKFREKHEHMLFFDTDDASSPRNLFCVQRKEANTVLAEVLPAAAFERIRFVETELCCMIGAFYPMELLRVRDWCATLRVQELVSVFKDFAAIPHTDTPCDYYVDYTQEATELLTRDPMAEAAAAAATGVAGEVVDAAAANVQKKVSSWWTSEVYNELHPRALRTPKQPLIVVGSLLENPVNIAGLCRCGEIFAVESIVVPEKKVFEHPHFVAAARSAELWIPWEEVLPKDLPGYLESLRRQGYTIVGIEQTANSISMEAFAFPERCAVVLGAEGQGVPAPLIPLLDVCVEIPQYGLIRSLNVHVSGAIAMYEYTRQHLMGRTQ